MASIAFTNSEPNHPLHAPWVPDPKLSPTERALARFSVTGNAIVTGGAGALGFEACRTLLEHGLRGLSIFDLAPAFERAQKHLDDLRAEFPSVKIIEEVVDVRNEEEVQAAVTSTTEKLGSVDILLCFAGIGAGGPSTTFALEDWKRILDVNTTGTWLCAQAVSKQMIQQGTGGSMVFMASTSGSTVLFPLPVAAYGVSKAAVRQMANCLAAEWAHHGIRVNTLSPGYIDTVMTQGELIKPGKDAYVERVPLGRIGHVSDLSGAIVLFCSPAGRYLTGVEILLDGGKHTN